AVLGRQPAEEPPAQAFGRELDRRQRIAYLVCEAPRDFAPRRIALRAIEHGQVVEYRDRSGFARQRRAAQHEHAPALAGFDDDFLAPLARPLAQVARERPGERREFGMATLQFRRRRTEMLRK